MKKILFFNYEYPPLGGGAANATKCILEEYSKREDISIDLVTSSINEEYVQERLGSNVIIHRLPIGKSMDNLNYQSKVELIRYSIKAYNFSKKLIKENEYDLSHSFFAVPCGVISWMLNKKYKIPYIVSLRGSDVPGYSERFRQLYKILTPIIHMVWKKASFVVTNSKGLTELARSSNGEQQFIEIMNGIDTDFYKPRKKSLHNKQREFRILLASRLSRRKGFDYAIKAMSEITKKYPHVKMKIAGGDGNAASEWKSLVKELSLGKYIEFTGAYLKGDAVEMYSWADVFVMPSFNEGMSNNLLEALASGLPVLMTPTGGAEELVHNNKNGFLIKMKDVNSIVRELEKLIKSEKLCDIFGRESRNIAESMSWKNVADEYVGLYNNVGTLKKVKH